MKKILLIIIAIVSFTACSNDDDCQENNNLNAQFNKNFLLNEKWFLDEVSYINQFDFNGDGKIEAELKNELNNCEFDNYIIFDKTQTDFVVYHDGDNICQDFGDLHPGFVDGYEVGENSLRFSFSLLGFGRTSSSIDLITAQIAPDSSFKTIKGRSTIIIGNEGFNINYSLIARSNDRP